MSADLPQLLDKQAIHEVMMRYCRGVDRSDVELLRSTYWPDAWDDHGAFSGLRDKIVDDIMAWRATVKVSIHSIANELIELLGDAALSECYFTGYYELLHDGRAHTRVSCGRYVDRFERRGTEWRIARRTVVNDWGRLDPLETPVTPIIPGRPYPDDPVYTLRGAYLGVDG